MANRPKERSSLARLIAPAGLLIAIAATQAWSTELSGICIFVCGPGIDSNRCDPVALGSTYAWHTDVDPSAAPILVTSGVPIASYHTLPLNPTGSLSYPLAPNKYVFTAMWQPEASSLPLRLGFNFFFNRDTLTPGISIIVPAWAGVGFTFFHPNFSWTTFSLFAREIENPQTTQYSDGENIVTVSALFAVPSSLFAPVDLVGLQRYGRDGRPDAVAIIELTVVPAAGPTPNFDNPPPFRPAPQVVSPPSAIVGPDESGGMMAGGSPLPPTPPLGTPAPSEVRPEAQPTPDRTSTLPTTVPDVTPAQDGSPTTASPIVRTQTALGTITPSPERRATPSVRAAAPTMSPFADVDQPDQARPKK